MRVEYYKIDKRVITQNPTLGIGDGCHRAAERVPKCLIVRGSESQTMGNVFECGVPYSIFEYDETFSRLKRLQ